uniref:VWFA domain-containing protein n=1 Tax=Arcella intermedia TaxID=1963864 RepID=A0A6B2L4C3_9EUKA
MAGQLHSGEDSPTKLEAVKQYAVELVGKLEPGDSVSVVLFDDKAETLLPPTKVSEDARKKVEDALKDVKTRGGTDVSSGMEEGIKLAREAKRIRNLDGPQETRLLMFSDMSDSEVRSAEKTIQQMTTQSALDNIHCSYIGIGVDFDQDLTEKITIAQAANYFCIKNNNDFTKRVATELASAFFPTVKSVEIVLTVKQFKVTGVYGGGKSGPVEEEDKEGWSKERQHLYPESTQLTAERLREQNFPSEVIGVIVDKTDTKPLTIFTENSVFPSPITVKPGYQDGGWIFVGLEPEQLKGDAKGFIRFETKYTDFNDKLHKITKDVDFGDAEKAISEGKEWASSEGVEKAIVLKQYVDVMRQVLADENCFEFPKEFLDWFEIQATKHTLTKELEKVNKLKDLFIKLATQKNEDGGLA